MNPILLGLDKVLIAGRARLLAAWKLGMSEVPVIVLGHLPEAQRRALVIAHNRLALNAAWDEAMLRIELAALGEVDFNLDLTGFAGSELDESRQAGPSASSFEFSGGAARLRSVGPVSVRLELKHKGVRVRASCPSPGACATIAQSVIEGVVCAL